MCASDRWKVMLRENDGKREMREICTQEEWKRGRGRGRECIKRYTTSVLLEHRCSIVFFY